ncbi:MAG: hypothetical protein CFE38_05365 [Comamonadaceae bacterium PBBC1]|nr:MAG: hypothetical protein CFE38_05365 [Comamonadaceae bacterium PBBC1]
MNKKTKNINKIFECLFNGKNCTKIASSKEHLISSKRLNQIKLTNKILTNANDNIKKTYKHITCESCNNELGIYESKSEINLGYATIWKLLAINYSKQEIKINYLKFKNTSLLTIFKFMTILQKCIKENGVFENSTFVFDYYLGAKVEPTYNQGIFQSSIKSVDENGNPIEDVNIYISTNGFHSGDRGFATKSDESGTAKIRILKNADYLNIFSVPFYVVDHARGFISQTFIEWAFYAIINSNGARILIALPLTDEKIAKYLDERIYKSNLEEIIKNNFTELEILNLKSLSSLKTSK